VEGGGSVNNFKKEKVGFYQKHALQTTVSTKKE